METAAQAVRGWYDISVEVDGHRYAGWWQIRQGGMICVSFPAIGSKLVPVGKAKPETVALKTLRELVTKWKAKQDRERRG